MSAQTNTSEYCGNLVRSGTDLPPTSASSLMSSPPPKSSKRKWDQPGPGEEAGSTPKVAKTDEARSASEAAAAAAAIAAKIAAQFANGTLGGSGAEIEEFTHNIDINDVRNRYLLTKGSTQEMVCLCHFVSSKP